MLSEPFVPKNLGRSRFHFPHIIHSQKTLTITDLPSAEPPSTRHRTVPQTSQRTARPEAITALDAASITPPGDAAQQAPLHPEALPAFQLTLEPELLLPFRLELPLRPSCGELVT